MPCEHDFGVIENFDAEKDYADLDGFGEFSAALKAYGCVSIDDDALIGWYPRIENMAAYWETYSRPEKGLALYSVTLIPPESLDLFYSIVKENTPAEFSKQASAVLSVIEKAKRGGKYVIHFGV